MVWLANIIALLLLGLVAFDVTYNGVLDGGKNPSGTQVDGAAGPKPLPDVDLGKVINAHLFGTKTIEAPPEPQVVEAPQTRLDLKLIGVFANENPDYSVAIVTVNRGKQTAYRVGDSIDKTDATLHQVEGDRVLIDRKGRLESLPLERKSLPDSAISNETELPTDAEPEPPAGLETETPTDPETETPAEDQPGGTATSAVIDPSGERTIARNDDIKKQLDRITRRPREKDQAVLTGKLPF